MGESKRNKFYSLPFFNIENFKKSMTVKFGRASGPASGLRGKRKTDHWLSKEQSKLKRR